MAYRIEGLPYQAFAGLFDLSDEDLENRGMKRVVATSDRGFPCRV